MDVLKINDDDDDDDDVITLMYNILSFIFDLIQIISKSRYIVLRISNVPPHRLEIYHNINSSSGRVINLENVRFVNSIKNVFVIEFDLKVLHFICENGE